MTHFAFFFVFFVYQNSVRASSPGLVPLQIISAGGNDHCQSAAATLGIAFLNMNDRTACDYQAGLLTTCVLSMGIGVCILPIRSCGRQLVDAKPSLLRFLCWAAAQIRTEPQVHAHESLEPDLRSMFGFRQNAVELELDRITASVPFRAEMARVKGGRFSLLWSCPSHCTCGTWWRAIFHRLGTYF